MTENLTSSDDIYASIDLTYYAMGCCVLSVVCFAGNGLIIFTILKQSEMREKSHLLVLSLAFADFLTCLGVLITAVATFVGYDRNIAQKTCLITQAVLTYWSSVDNVLILLMGIDRVIILCQPFRYASWPTKKYVAKIIAVALCFGLLILIMAVINANDSRVALCVLPSAMNGFAKPMWTGLNAIICLGVIVCYVTAGALVRKRKVEHGAATAISVEYRRLLASLTIVAAVYVFSTLFPVFVTIVFKLIIHLDPVTFQQYSIYSVWTILIQISCAPFVYYMRSRDYRTAFQKVLCGKKEMVESIVFSHVNNAGTSMGNTARQPIVAPTTSAVAKKITIHYITNGDIINNVNRKLTSTDIVFLPSDKN